MLKKYDNLKVNLGSIKKEIANNKFNLNGHIETRSSFKKLVDTKNRQREKEIAEHIADMKEKYVNDIVSKYDIYLEELSKYRSHVNSEFLKINNYIDSYGFVNNESYHKKVDMMEGSINDLNVYLEPIMTKDLLEMYKQQGYGHNMDNLTLEKLKEWLKYFDNYEVHNRVIGKALKAEKMIVGKVDTSIILVGIIFVGGILIQHRFITILPYLLFILVTVYIRTKEFYTLLRLFGLYGYTKDRIQELEDTNSKELKRYADYYSKTVGEEYLKYQELIRKMEEEIKKEKEKNTSKVLESFDKDKAREKAEGLIETDTENTLNLLEEEENHIEELSEILQKLTEELRVGKEELKRLKDDIREVYQNLTPSFSSLNMIESFFLGFKDDEPVRFEYSGKPALIFYNSGTGELDAVMTTIKMMCGQIMTTLNPLAYSINVVDILTGGAPLSSFQVTERNEDDMYESRLFKVASTTSDSSKLIGHLFEQYNMRRVRVLGNHSSIVEYNKKKIDTNARTMPYEICFFYEYDYKLLEEELMRQLTRIAHSIGFCLFFMIDVSKIEPPDKKDDKEEDKEESNKVFQYQIETLYKIFNLFEENNIYGFDVRKDDIDIVNVKKAKIISNIIELNER